VGTRHRARQYAIQILFQLDATGDEPEEALPLFWEGRPAPGEVMRFTEGLVCGAHKDLDRLDSVLEESTANWKVERIAMVERNVLRLALFELLHGDTPVPVVLDEAIELAKQFGDADSGPFVNGILDAVSKRLDEGSLVRVSPA
jgi:N utilization substance protein B